MAHNLFSRWRYRTSILFSGCDQSVYQQDVVVHRSAGIDYEETSGPLKIWHIYIGANCRTDYGDVRFSDRFGAELPYYLWEDYDSSSARFCVRLGGATSAGTLVLHYGNPSATTTSDGDATYYRFDGFSGSSIDASKWGNTSGYDVLSGYLRKTAGDGHSTPAYIYSDVADLPAAFLVDAHVRNSNSIQNRGGLAIFDSDTHYWCGYAMFTPYTSEWYQFSSGSWSATGEVVWTGTPSSTTAKDYLYRVRYSTGSAYGAVIDPDSGSTLSSGSKSMTPNGRIGFHFYDQYAQVADIVVRAYSAAPPSLLRTSRWVNPVYAGLLPLLPDNVIRFGGVGSIQVLGDEIYSVAGAGGFSIETTVRSAIAIAGAGSAALGTHLTLAPAEISGAGGVAAYPVRLHTPITMEGGAGSVYAVPVPIEVSLDPYKFESLTVSRSIQDQMWQCSGQIDGFLSPAPYRYFSISRPDRTDVSRMIFRGYIPGRKYIQAPAANKASILAYDPTYILSRQPAPEGEISFRQIDGWNPVTIIRYLLGEEGPTASSAASRWESVTGIYPYRIGDPYARSQTVEGYSYTPKDWTFSANASKAQIIQEICEYCGYVFLVKWKDLGSGYVACAYFVHEDDIDSSVSGLDLPYPVTIVNPHPGLVPPLRADERGEERYNRVTVRSSGISGDWNSYTMETKAVQNGDELPLVYTEERSDLGSLDLVIARCAELYDYYCQTAYTYTATIENQVDLELYQIVRFSGYSLVSTDDMRVIAISYDVQPLKTNVTITFTPTSRLSDLRALLRNQQADFVAEIQTIAKSEIDKILQTYVGDVSGVDEETGTATVDLERGDVVTTRTATE